MWKIGDKVIPIAKTQGSTTCKHWKLLQSGAIPFLYVVDVDTVENIIVCNSEPREHVGTSGNFYAPDDLLPYGEALTEDKLFDMLLQGKITDKQYENMMKQGGKSQ